MKKNILAFCLIIIAHLTNAQTIISGEYFIDSDPGVGQSPNMITLTAASDSTWQLPTLSATGLSIGYHKLYMRLMDNNGMWGHTIRKNIEVIQSDDSLSVVEVEYFWQSDLEFGNCFSVFIPAPARDINYTFNIPFANLPSPFALNDTLFIRVKDSVNGRWSHTAYIENINIDTTNVGLIEIPDLTYRIYPNPVNSLINIELTNDMLNNANISIFDQSGKIVGNFKLHDKMNCIDIKNLQSGIYFLKVYDDFQTSISKLIKQ